MTQQCPNCGQESSAGDVVCWQCGWQLVEGDLETLLAQQAAEMPASPWQWPPYSRYAALTLFLFLAALLLMGHLGRQPLLQLTSSTGLEPGWTMIASGERSFVVNLPQAWRWLDEERQGQVSGAAGLAAHVVPGTFPLGAGISDERILFVAMPPDVDPAAPSLYLVVASSRQLNELSPEQAIARVRQAQVNLMEAAFVADYDKSSTHLALEQAAGGQTLRCRQRLVAGQQESLLVAACGDAAHFSRSANEISLMLDSFQRLAP